MDNNDILRRLRYILNYSDAMMIGVFEQAGYAVEPDEIHDLLRKETDPELLELTDKMLAVFLNGLILEKRGRREGPEPEPEDFLDNNAIFRKIKIAFDLKSDDILEMYRKIEKPISAHELSSFFRKPEQKQYRLCNDQYLRHFLMGLQMRYRNSDKEE